MLASDAHCSTTPTEKLMAYVSLLDRHGRRTVKKTAPDKGG